MLITEKVFLLLTTDKGGGEPWVGHRHLALNGALLCDLAANGLITLERKRLSLRVGAAVASSSVQNPVLRHGLEHLERRGTRRLKSVLEARKFARPDVVAQRLVSEGILEQAEKGFLFVSWNKYPTRDPRAEESVRAGLQAALHGQQQESWDDAIVFTLLNAIDAVGAVLRDESKGTKRRDRREALNEMAYSLVAPELERTEALLGETVQAVQRGIADIIAEEEQQRAAAARARR